MALHIDSIQEIYLTRKQLKQFHETCKTGSVWEKLRAKGDESLEAGPFSVMNKGLVAPSGDKHDFLRLPTYGWPNPDTPDGLPYITRDGVPNPAINGPDVDQGRLSQMTRAIINLAWATLVTGEKSYAKHALLLLRVWFLDPKTRMNPNLTYSKYTPGEDEGPFPTGVIATHNWVKLMQAIGILKGTDMWTDELDSGLTAWFLEFLEWMQTSEQGTAEQKMTNNRGICYDAQIASYARFIGDDNLAHSIVAGSCNRLDVQVAADGSLPRELTRTISLTYTLMTLRAWCMVGLMGDQLGCDVWHWSTDDGRGLRLALDYTDQYVGRPNEWPHQQIKPPSFVNAIYAFTIAAWAYQDPSLLIPLTRLDPDEVAKDPVTLLF